MYQGTDRTKQVNALNQLAEQMFESLPTEVGPTDITPEEVRTLLTLSSDPRDHEMPDWFDDHDLKYLANQIRTHFSDSDWPPDACPTCQVAMLQPVAGSTDLRCPGCGYYEHNYPQDTP